MTFLVSSAYLLRDIGSVRRFTETVMLFLFTKLLEQSQHSFIPFFHVLATWDTQTRDSLAVPVRSIVFDASALLRTYCKNFMTSLDLPTPIFYPSLLQDQLNTTSYN